MQINPISFGKKYLGKAPVRNNSTGKREMLNFVEYDSKKDIKQIEKTSKKWGTPSELRGVYAGYVAKHMKKSIKYPGLLKDLKYYGIEDRHRRIQALCEVLISTKNEKTANITYGAVNPENSYGSTDRKYSKLGTSIFREILKLAKKDNIKNVWLIDGSKGFWNSIPLIKKDKFGICTISDTDYSDCAEILDKMI